MTTEKELKDLADRVQALEEHTQIKRSVELREEEDSRASDMKSAQSANNETASSG